MFISKTLVIKLKLAFGRKDKYVVTQECKNKIISIMMLDVNIKGLDLSKEKDDFKR